MQLRTTTISLNGNDFTAEVEPRTLLSDFIRHEAGLTGTHVGCEHGVCGACTVEVDGAPVRSCLMFAAQAEGCHVRTVEAVAGREDDELSILQQAFHERHALQCGFCTPGFLMALQPLLLANQDFTEEEIREAISGNLCRCTGYESIVNAVTHTLEQLRIARTSNPVAERDSQEVAS
ncbi:4-hydroxybenzoyl-CoA reductase subunit gamma [Rhodococcus sp. 06-156-3C]|uniref:(2Fe-2S)-binding protein n=1 Tax=Nocardiaceae TaxID=85025 RepID=UPI000522F1BB|nr:MULTISPECIES: (2Fe-2S)-binding protein [Rhodococcus]OZD12588.1 4-hydroxybenzoyl-CoA reductase subunit gamma [Rhodococcus sp. 06-156-4a]OZD18003.1 4-hydroxybenzoyl-CoA reductase subunit gamma [Rhodococcus sp. 06-156-3C]OZD20437.1 4-hydroxybenzoyl-CoA reductase subunit gamma [Rhodococcus sp. 06-156-4C]OZD29281.1 4-hydroxybenzoyl-CoA reductase subunit gamma [Rhodococcus sp. 06-156-3]OZD30553.1 4-hydroxybenzoyl-CoA reductase subunit gamma [Rhodococcus sp. 06-156-3b]